MHPIEELELLAKWGGYLEGRSRAWDTPRVSHAPYPNGRPDAVDEKSDEITAALRAKSTLQRLYQSGERGKQQAELLARTYVLCGALARKKLVSASSTRQPKHIVPKRASSLAIEFIKRQQERLLQEALDSYVHILLK
jgi:hypothetical protein